VRDSATGVDSYVGKIRVPTSWGWLNSGSVAWTANFGALPSTCAGFPWAKAQFNLPTADNGSVRTSSHSHSFGGGDCPTYSRILHVPGADVQEMGKAPPAAARPLIEDSAEYRRMNGQRSSSTRGRSGRHGWDEVVLPVRGCG
jgi:hypothetical protein